ncbi:MAG: serine protease [Acidobacteria bacterium]|nr:MAG: serine protease [Acidobacteriota bacterium]
MKPTWTTLRIGVSVFWLALGAARAADPPNPRTVPATLEVDPAVKGSPPYEEAVLRFIRKEQPKVVGGREAPSGAFPWQVSLGVSWIADPFYAHFCAGSVYSERWIVTAAHCTTGLNPSQLVVTAGTNRLGDGATRQNVRRIIVNKDYNSDTHDNDISLIELLEPLQTGAMIKPVRVVQPDMEPHVLVDGTKLVVTGWGAIEEGGKPVRNLRFLADLPFVPRPDCNAPLSYNGAITENMICAGVRAGGKDSCQGDSGGPLTVDSENGPLLVGVVSWGEGCARPNKVGVYTRVSKYVDWIQTSVKDTVALKH